MALYKKSQIVGEALGLTLGWQAWRTKQPGDVHVGVLNDRNNQLCGKWGVRSPVFLKQPKNKN
jgi:hypothetical protein